MRRTLGILVWPKKLPMEYTISSDIIDARVFPISLDRFCDTPPSLRGGVEQTVNRCSHIHSAWQSNDMGEMSRSFGISAMTNGAIRKAMCRKIHNAPAALTKS